MGSFLNKILSVIGYEDKDDYYEEEIIEEESGGRDKDTEAADNLQFETESNILPSKGGAKS